jgi:hypothetical protein
MTPELFFIPTYPTYYPTVKFLFNFLNFHSYALLCHLLISLIILMHSIAICFFCSPFIKRPHLPCHRVLRIKELILCDVLFGNPDITPPQLAVLPAHTCCTSPPTKLTMRHGGDDALLTHFKSRINTVTPQ